MGRVTGDGGERKRSVGAEWTIQVIEGVDSIHFLKSSLFLCSCLRGKNRCKKLGTTHTISALPFTIQPCRTQSSEHASKVRGALHPHSLPCVFLVRTYKEENRAAVVLRARRTITRATVTRARARVRERTRRGERGRASRGARKAKVPTDVFFNY